MLKVIMVLFLVNGDTPPSHFSLSEYDNQYSEQINARIEYHARKREGKQAYTRNFLEYPGACRDRLAKIRAFYDKANQSVRRDSFCLVQEEESE